ncbi:MAG: response regulator [Deltaproteobacteria bacterium]|nr:response regulator [Deltaproteobacteria bacterium]
MSKRILVADDAASFRRLEEMLLKTRGYTTLSAKDGAEALKRAIVEQPDLILLDIQMPVMDGVQTLAALKRDSRTKRIPVIIVTTLGRDKDRDILLKGGASDLIGKPVDGLTLVRKIRALLGE